MDMEHVLEQTGYKDILKLLYTNGELDIDKVLCLHILNTCPYKFLELPCRVRNSTSFLARDQSPLEKLIERSRTRKAMNSKSTSHPLPTYVLNLKEKESEDRYANSARSYSSDSSSTFNHVSSQWTVDNISQLVQAVLEALQKSNPQKMSRLLEVAQKPSNLQYIMNKPELQEFLINLFNKRVISSSGVNIFAGSSSASISLNIENPADTLQKLVNVMHSNILKDFRKQDSKGKLNFLRDSWDISHQIKKMTEPKYHLLEIINYLSGSRLRKKNVDELPIKESADKLSSKSCSTDNYSAFPSPKSEKPSTNLKAAVPKKLQSTNKTLTQKKIITGSTNLPRKSKKLFKIKRNDNITKLGILDDILKRKSTIKFSYKERDMFDEDMEASLASSNISTAASTRQCCPSLKAPMTLRKFHCCACFDKWKLTSSVRTNPNVPKCIYIDDDTSKHAHVSNSLLLPKIIEREVEDALCTKQRICKENKEWNEKLRQSRKHLLIKPIKFSRYNERSEGKSTKSLDTLHDLGLLLVKNTVSANENNKKIQKFLNEPLFEKSSRQVR